MYRHVMLVDGNDGRGIDVGILTKPGFPIHTIRSHVDARDAVGVIFSRDCPDFEVHTPSGQVLHLLVNHFKSKSGGGGARRRRQAEQVRKLVDDLVDRDQHVLVLGDLNEGQPDPTEPPPNLTALFTLNGPLTSCYDLDGFDPGPRPGSFDTCSIRNRLDYILISASLRPTVTGGTVFRTGLWGSRRTRPTAWPTSPQIIAAVHQASDHAAVVLHLDL
jgi:endonuclease/exonuclease/phosphatase family metal-dependent hydrolase